MKLIEKLRSLAEKYPGPAEVVRFLIAGGIATIVDMFVMGVVLYLFDSSLYPKFYNVWYGGGNPTAAAAVTGTGAGFVTGLIINYVFSVLFVFNHKGNSRTVGGFAVFTALSAVGLGLHLGGMYLGYDVMGINEWIVKIVMTFVVLIYNYVSKRLLLFRDKAKDTNDRTADGCVAGGNRVPEESLSGGNRVIKEDISRESAADVASHDGTTAARQEAKENCRGKCA